MLQKLTGPFREFGLFAGTLYAIDRLLQIACPAIRLYCYELMVQPIHGEPLLPPRFAKGVEMREIRRGDPEVALMPARPDIKESRFEQKALCLGAFMKGKLIGYIWFCFGTYEEDEVRCTYVLAAERESVFDFDLYIFPEHRMGLAFLAVWNGANQFLASRGVKFTFSRLTRFNLASRRAHQHLGWKLVDRAVFVRAWRVQLMVATAFPYVHLSVSEADRVRLQMRADALGNARAA